jgi:DDE family transposase
MIVKQNQKTLFNQLNSLDWANIPISHETTETGHGRRERRTIQVLDAPAELDFPNAAQVFLIERYTTRTMRKRTKGSRKYKTVTVHTAVAVLGITSLSAREAAPKHLATYVRGHWAIENKIHWVRDVTFREDASQVKNPPPDPASWSHSATSPSDSSDKPATPTSPPPSDKSDTTHPYS